MWHAIEKVLVSPFIITTTEFKIQGISVGNAYSTELRVRDTRY